jgi:glycosyltransferase involved in cell wall biosynthesis
MNNEEDLQISVIGLRAYPSDFKGTSGIEVYVENVLKEISILNKNYNFILYTKVNYKHHKHNQKNVKIKKIPTVKSKVLESVIYSLFSSISAGWDDSQIVWYQGTGAAIFSFIPWIFGKKIIVTIHGFDWKRKKWSNLERIVFSIATRLVLVYKITLCVVSEEMQRAIKSLYKVDSLVMNPGFYLFSNLKYKNTDLLNNIVNKDFLLYVGRIVPEKRIDWLIESFSSLNKEKEEYQLVITGTHGNYPQYEKKLKSHFSDKNVIWAGYLSNMMRNILLANCSLFVLASEVEGGNPISFLEALGFSKYCVVPSGIVSDKYKKLTNVYFFSKNSKKSLTEILRKASLKQEREEQFTYSKKELSFLKNYSWKKTSKKYIEIFSR